MQDNRKTGIGGKVLLALTMIFFYLPILYIIVFSFNGSRSLTHLEGFSLRWYEKMFADSNMMEAVVYTIVIAVLATVISTIAGTLAAIGMSRSKKILRNLVDQVNNLPINRYRAADVFQRPWREKGLCDVASGAYYVLYPLCDTVCYAEAALP